MSEPLSKQIAQELLGHINTGEWKLNDKLPSERELSQKYNASRNVIRESIKILVEKNLVINIPGKGNYVSQPTESMVATQLESAINHTSIPIREVIDARELLEISVLNTYITTISEEQIQQLESLYEKMQYYSQNYLQFSKYDKDFHLYLMTCSQNSVLQLFLSTLYNMTYKNIVTESPNPARVIKLAQADHLDIIQAIKAKDTKRLTAALKRHIKPVRNLYEN